MSAVSQGPPSSLGPLAVAWLACPVATILEMSTRKRNNLNLCTHNLINTLHCGHPQCYCKDVESSFWPHKTLARLFSLGCERVGVVCVCGGSACCSGTSYSTLPLSSVDTRNCPLDIGAHGVHVCPCAFFLLFSNSCEKSWQGWEGCVGLVTGLCQHILHTEICNTWRLL